MSDEEFKMLTFDDFAKYLGTLCGEQICPMCSGKSWTLFIPSKLPSKDEISYVTTSIPGAVISKDTSNVFIRSKNHDVLLMQCGNCGYTAFFNYRKVKENIESGEYIKKTDESTVDKHDESEN